MGEKEQKERKKRGSKIDYVATGLIMMVIALCSLVLFAVTSKKETLVSEKKESQKTTILHCVAEDPVNPFFVSERAVSHSHELKVTFKDDNVDKFSYSYHATYSSEALADTAHSELHADYNKYMGANGMIQESLSPIFTNNGLEAKANLYSGISEGLNSITARLFFLDLEEYEKIDEYNKKDLEEVYNNKGFSCDFGS